MPRKRSKHSRHLAKRIGLSIERVFSAPFEALPSAFGDQTPPDLKVLEAQVEEAQHDVVELPGQPGVHPRASKPARRK
jgi:hypothetical protein